MELRRSGGEMGILHTIILRVHSCTFSENEMKHKLMLLRILQNVKVLSNTGVVNTGPQGSSYGIGYTTHLSVQARRQPCLLG